MAKYFLLPKTPSPKTEKTSSRLRRASQPPLNTPAAALDAAGEEASGESQPQAPPKHVMAGGDDDDAELSDSPLQLEVDEE